MFVSHNRSMLRREKFLILALHMNLRAAVFNTACAVVVIAPLSATELLPTIVLTDGSRLGPWCQVIGLATFMVTLSCWKSFAGCDRVVESCSSWTGHVHTNIMICSGSVASSISRRYCITRGAFRFVLVMQTSTTCGPCTSLRASCC